MGYIFPNKIEGKLWNPEDLFMEYMYLHKLAARESWTQGQFLRGDKDVWIQSFPSWQVAIKKLRSPVYPTIHENAGENYEVIIDCSFLRFRFE